MQHSLHCGLLTYLADQKHLDIHWEQALELQSKVQEILLPWLKSGDKAPIYKKLSNMWEEVYGKLSDPETQEKLNKAVAELRKRSQKR